MTGYAVLYVIFVMYEFCMGFVFYTFTIYIHLMLDLLVCIMYILIIMY